MGSELIDICLTIGFIILIIFGATLGWDIETDRIKEDEAMLKQAGGNYYVGTKKTGVFHYYDCRHVRRKYRAWKSFDVTFPIKEVAKKYGYLPCSDCISW